MMLVTAGEPAGARRRSPRQPCRSVLLLGPSAAHDGCADHVPGNHLREDCAPPFTVFPVESRSAVAPLVEGDTREIMPLHGLDPLAAFRPMAGNPEMAP